MSNQHYDIGSFEKLGNSRKTGKLLYISTAKYGGDWHSLPHTHDCTELFYVVSGRGQFKVDDSVFPIEADDMIFVNPQIEHTESSLNAQPLEYIVVGIEGLEFSLESDHNTNYSIFNFRHQREDILPFLRYILAETQQKSTSYEFVCQNLLEILIVKLVRHTNFFLNVGPIRRTSKECAAVKRYIDENFKESLSLDQLADVAHVNKYYLVHSFSKEYNISPINYLIERRIRESCTLLRDTNHSLSQIAHMLGFSSPSYFSQSFRKLRQMSPMEYRKKQHAEKAADKAKEST